jgi:hypothetical protein
MPDNSNLSKALDLTVAITQSLWQKTCVMPRLVDNRYESDLTPANKGEAIALYDVNALTAGDITPGAYPAANNTLNIAQRSLSLDYHKNVSFKITTKDLDSIHGGVAPRSLQSAINALSESVDSSIFSEVKKNAYQFVGTAGTTPYASNIDILSDASRMLTTAKAPKTERYHVLDEFAMGNARKLAQFREADKAGTMATLDSGEVAQAYGFGWYESNNVAQHTTTRSGNYSVDANATAGALTLVVDDSAGASPTALVVGDVFTIAGNTQQYTITSYTAATPTANECTIGIFPALAANVTDGAVMTVTASHRLNMVFHRDAIAFASRPYVNSPITTGVIQRTIPDPETGLILDLRIHDAWFESYWSISALWGCCVVPNKEGGIVRILG